MNAIASAPPAALLGGLGSGLKSRVGAPLWERPTGSKALGFVVPSAPEAAGRHRRIVGLVPARAVGMYMRGEQHVIAGPRRGRRAAPYIPGRDEHHLADSAGVRQRSRRAGGLGDWGAPRPEDRLASTYIALVGLPHADPLVGPTLWSPATPSSQDFLSAWLGEPICPASEAKKALGVGQRAVSIGGAAPAPVAALFEVPPPAPPGRGAPAGAMRVVVRGISGDEPPLELELRAGDTFDDLKERVGGCVSVAACFHARDPTPDWGCWLLSTVGNECLKVFVERGPRTGVT